MTRTSFQQLVASILEATTGAPADEAVLGAVQRVLADVGLGDDRQVPGYFVEGLRRVLAGATTGWERLPEAEQGLGWILCRLADVVPGTSSTEVGAFDRFAVPALGRGVVVHRREAADGYSEWYAVEPVDAAGQPLAAPARPGPTVLGTFQPSVAQIRQWAYDPDLYFSSQDEESAIDDLGFLDLLVELAADRAGPKRARIRDVIHAIGPGRILSHGDAARAPLAAVATALGASADPELCADGATAAAVGAYLDGHGAVDADAAVAIARGLLASPGRPAPSLDVDTVDGWWQVTVRRAAPPVVERLYVQQASGALAYRRDTPLAAAVLAALGTPVTRAALLGGR